MKKKFFLIVVTTSLVSNGLMLSNISSNEVVYAENLSEELDISSSLRKLGVQSILIQMYIDEANMRPNIHLIELPELNTIQSDIKRDMIEWANELNPRLIQLSTKSKGFINKFDSYYPSLKHETEDEKEKQELLDRLDVLQSQVTSNKSKIQSAINEITMFKSQLDKKMKKLSIKVEEGEKLLGSSDGKVNRYKKEILEAQKAINEDLKEIASVPGALNSESWEVFKEVYSLSKDLISPVAESAMAAVNNGKEINDRIKKAVNDAEETAKKENKSEQEIEEAKKKAREKVENARKEDMIAAAKAEAEKHDYTKLLDPEKFEKISNEFEKINNLTAGQREKLADLQTQNESLYKVTKDLSVSELQQVRILEMKNDLEQFSEQITYTIELLTQYKKDWGEIGSCIDIMNSNANQGIYKSLPSKLRRLKDLRNQLEKQMQKFNSAEVTQN